MGFVGIHGDEVKSDLMDPLVEITLVVSGGKGSELGKFLWQLLILLATWYSLAV